MADPAPQTPDPAALMATARATVAARLPEIARELLSWHGTGLLPNGWLRRVAEPLQAMSPHDALGLAEKLAIKAALEAVQEAAETTETVTKPAAVYLLFVEDSDQYGTSQPVEAFSTAVAAKAASDAVKTRRSWVTAMSLDPPLPEIRYNPRLGRLW